MYSLFITGCYYYVFANYYKFANVFSHTILQADK